ncbi:type IV B pilus protein, partial [Pseudomonas aeruginosa ATCC 25324]
GPHHRRNRLRDRRRRRRHRHGERLPLGADDLAGFAFALQLPLRRGQTHLGFGEDGLGLDFCKFANGASAGLAGREEE